MREWALPRRNRIAIGALALSATILGCAPVSDPSVGLSAADAAAMIERAPKSELSSDAVAEDFALNTRATQVQRDMLQSKLVGRAVDWDIRVYEVEFADGRFAVTSQAIPIADIEATPLLRVKAFVSPQSADDEVLLRGVRTDDMIRIRGIVQEIRLRTVVVIAPAVVHPDKAHAAHLGKTGT